MSFKSLVNRIDTLPALSYSAQKILAMYAQEDDSDVDVRKLTRLIQEDTLLTANILGMINDPKLGFNNKITAVGQAVTLFGSRIMKGFIISFVMKQRLQADMGAYGISNARFNDMCHLQSALLYQWYMKIDMNRAKTLVPLALIMEAGKVVFAAEMNESDYVDIFKEEILSAENMEEIEHRYSDTSSYYIGGLLFEHWNFSQYYSDLMKSLDFDNEDVKVDQLDLDILDVVRTAINVKGFLDKENMAKAQALVKSLGLDEVSFMHAALRIKNAYEEALRAKVEKL
ncbi:HDOD domain-containing protein [Sulfurimonas sp. MAG313]|nr:HDOD domain-containing protein [Sulfurimonas sp. MAG313]MDF1880957.1 HDOD domain-containing protein [Sulfurimonas sp. MAG313]